MEVSLIGVGKRFKKDWIFRDLTHVFKTNSSTAIIGNNGSGKSTLLRLITTFSDPTLGEINYDKVHPEQQISFVAPYLELIEELTLQEHLEFHFQFRKATLSFQEMMEKGGLANAKDKQIINFSSGMKQRLKLILAFFSTDSLMILDEPCSNLDENGIAWYQEQLQSIISKKTIIIASNQRFEYQQCIGKLDITAFKKRRK